ncbi:MAG: hypothetical protein LN415_03315 [Candidatus Thermoplasmatota archaeon]|nr:hypothetical protein [Candidatus Thermoplasmatota archaeon]
MVRKTINIDDWVNRLVNVVMAKALLDVGIEVSYRDAVNNILVLGLKAFSNPKYRKMLADAYQEEFLEQLERNLTKMRLDEELEEFFDFLEPTPEED